MRVICVGDSITYGQNVRAEEAWPAVLARATGWDVRNEGVCGDTTRLGLERFPKAVQLQRPNAVVLQFGHNDANCWETDLGQPRVSRDAYVANLREMTARAIAAGARRVIVLQPHGVPGKGPDYNGRLGEYRRALVDGPTALSGWCLEPPELSTLDDGYDGIHPNPAMHERYAELVESALATVADVHRDLVW